MLVKFFNRGTGKGKGPVEYILKETDAQGLIREPLPSLIKGNPQQTINLIDSLDFKQKYKSGVISFAPTDAPTNEQLEAVINSFEETAFAGLSPDQYDILWVKHTHTGSDRVELHFVTPTVDLISGKSLNIAPPGANKYFEPWRDYWNLSQGWARPDDPQRARSYHPGHQALIDAQNARLELSGQQPLKRNEAKKMIHEYLLRQITEVRQIENRNDIITTLEDAGFTITRKGENYLTVTHDDLGQRIRLKGGIYHESWRPEPRTTTEARTGQTSSESDKERELTTVSAKLAAHIQKRREYNQHRYGTYYQTSPNLVYMGGLSTSSDFSSDLSGYLSRQLGDESIFNQPISTDSDQQNHPQPTQTGDLGHRTVSNQPGEIHHPTPQQSPPNRLEMQREALYQAVNSDDDSTRERTFRNLQELCHELREGQERTTGINRKITQSTEENTGVFNQSTERINQELLRNHQLIQQQNERLIRENRKARKRLSRHHERLRRIKEHQAQELDTFKTDINLADYAQANGYSIDKKKSSVNCLVLKDNRGDKILVGLNQSDGHYFYSSVNDDRDSGSIIDFIQNRRNLNLGEVRKELRPWINEPSNPPYSPKQPTPKLTPSSPDRHKIITQFEGFNVIVTHPYLTQRGISQQTSNDPRFQGRIYTDHRNNVIFPHADREGVCGYEMRNQDFKSFSSGGTKGLWASNGSPDDTTLVICESPLDCLSYHQLFRDDTTLYFATGGTLSDKQKTLLKGVFEKFHNKGGHIMIATDKDEAGQELEKELRNIAPETAQINRIEPRHHKDWNDALMAEQRLQREQQERQKRSRSRGFSR
ncbi:MAG: toprim domain-containing protein [Crocosphaera sp.]|nr:toprim domain-containing protein [Crocosphaera sp.]